MSTAALGRILGEDVRIHESAPPQRQLPQRVAGAGGQRDRRLFQQHRRAQPRPRDHRIGAVGCRRDARARDSGGFGRTHRRSRAGPLRPQADHDRERPDPRRHRVRFHLRHPSGPHWGGARAQRGADVRVAVFYQRARRHPAVNRQPEGTPRRQLPDPDYAVGHAHAGNAAGRLQCRQIRLRLGIRAERRLFPVLCRRDLAAAPRTRRLVPSEARRSRRGPPLERIQGGAAVHRLVTPHARHRPDLRRLGDRRRRGADPVCVVRRAGVSSRRGGHRHYLEFRGSRPAGGRRHRPRARPAGGFQGLQADRFRSRTSYTAAPTLSSA